MRARILRALLVLSLLPLAGGAIAGSKIAHSKIARAQAQPTETPPVVLRSEIAGPTGSVAFGSSVAVLPNGNYVIADPEFGGGIGAVYLYGGGTLGQLGRMAGDQAGDRVGSGGIVVLKGGGFVVSSPDWHGGRGAATRGSATAWGGVVSASNSLVGAEGGNAVGSGGIVALAGGGYVVASPQWEGSPAAANMGAVTWVGAAAPGAGTVSASNSLVGSKSGDSVGLAVHALENGNYVVASMDWDSGAVANAGAVTWGSGSSGVMGPVTTGNSLVGSRANDRVGQVVVPLANGHFVVCSRLWDGGDGAAQKNVGAVTWASGSGETLGVVSASNSLVGLRAEDRICENGVTPLAGGDYVVLSSLVDGASAADTGAATRVVGSEAVTGTVSEGNSLTGTQAGDQVGSGGAIALAGGGHVVLSPFWAAGAASSAGAATWVGGSGPFAGTVSAANSLVGSTNARVGERGHALLGGDYVVVSPQWRSSGDAAVGAVTLGDGETGTTGLVSATNSLTGRAEWDSVGSGGAVALAGGGTVVLSSDWQNDADAMVGAVTWIGAGASITGEVTSLNSLVGAVPGEMSAASVMALPNGHWLLVMPTRGSAADLGSVTLGNGRTGGAGVLSFAASATGAGSAPSITFDPARQAAVVGTPLHNSITLLAWGFPLTITHGGDGSGSITSTPAGINCGPTCTGLFAENTRVTLAAAPEPGSTFQGWSGACSGASCTIMIDGAQAANAAFQKVSYSLSVSKSGSGTGTVTSAPAGVSCGSTCTAQYLHGTEVELAALPATGSSFAGWSGACSEAGSCKVLMGGARAVDAAFSLQSFAVTLLPVQQGGTIELQRLDVAADAEPPADFPYGARLRLTARPANGFVFAGWMGDAAGKPNPAEITVDKALTIGAQFTPDPGPDPDPTATPEPAGDARVFLPAVQR